LVTLGVVTVLVALVSEIFVESVQEAAETFGMSQAFVGFVVVALVGGAAEMAVAFSAARKDRLDLSVGIALGERFPAILARRCGDGFHCHACRGVHYKQRAFGLVRRRSVNISLRGLCHHPLRVAAASGVRSALKGRADS
jgi:hypothetical protein